MTPVTLTGIEMSFGAAPAVAGVDLSVAGGELFFLLGPSGCGKTTLLRIIAGFLEPDRGSVRIGDRDVTRVSAHKRRTAMVFQGYALWPHMTVAGNLAFGLEMDGVSADQRTRRVTAALELVGMAELAARKPNQLSGGQQQRVALARALVVEPACLLLDEPLSNLDAKLRHRMRAEIRRICKDRGLTGLYVTHDQKEALSMADRIAVMNAGRIVQVGPPRELYRRPRSAFVADFLGETNFLSGEVVGAAGDGVRLRTALGGLTAVDPFGHATAGRTVTVCLRPEAVRMGAAVGEGGLNTFEGRSEETTYLGESAEHRISVSGHTLRVSEQNPPAASAVPGTPVRISFAAEDAVIVEPTPTRPA